MKELPLVTNEEFSIYPMPRKPLVTEGQVGFYNHGFKDYLFFSLDDGKPVRKQQLASLPLKEMYTLLVDHYSDLYNLTPFDTLWTWGERYTRRLSAEGLFITEDERLYTLMRLPFVYIDDSFEYDGSIVTATVNRSNYFVVFFDKNLQVDELFFIDDHGLPEKVGLNFKTRLLYKEDQLIAPLGMQPDHFTSFGDKAPAYARLVPDGNRFKVEEVYWMPVEEGFRHYGNVFVTFHPFYAPKNSESCYVSLGKKIRVLDFNTWQMSDEVFFEDPSCERISYIREKNGTFYYLCGDLVFSISDTLDFLLPYKSSAGGIIAEIDPKLTVNPFFDHDHNLYFFETKEDFSQTILKQYRLK